MTGTDRTDARDALPRRPNSRRYGPVPSRLRTTSRHGPAPSFHPYSSRLQQSGSATLTIAAPRPLRHVTWSSHQCSRSHATRSCSPSRRRAASPLATTRWRPNIRRKWTRLDGGEDIDASLAPLRTSPHVTELGSRLRATGVAVTTLTRRRPSTRAGRGMPTPPSRGTAGRRRPSARCGPLAISVASHIAYSSGQIMTHPSANE